MLNACGLPLCQDRFLSSGLPPNEDGCWRFRKFSCFCEHPFHMDVLSMNVVQADIAASVNTGQTEIGRVRRLNFQ